MDWLAAVCAHLLPNSKPTLDKPHLSHNFSWSFYIFPCLIWTCSWLAHMWFDRFGIFNDYLSVLILCSVREPRIEKSLISLTIAFFPKKPGIWISMVYPSLLKTFLGVLPFHSMGCIGLDVSGWGFRMAAQAKLKGNVTGKWSYQKG